MCVCLYDLAMPICIILDPLDPLIHIEGGSGWPRARAAAGAAPESGTAQSSPPVPARGSSPPQPPGLHGPERPLGAGLEKEGCTGQGRSQGKGQGKRPPVRPESFG